MLECIHDAVSVAGRVGWDNWYSRLQSLLAHVSHGGFHDPAAIDGGTGWVDVDLCMVRWRSFILPTACMTWTGIKPSHCSQYWHVSHMVCH